jgi:LPXTG-motif cell wall-anchored protein
MPRRIEPLGTQWPVEGVHGGARRGWTCNRGRAPRALGKDIAMAHGILTSRARGVVGLTSLMAGTGLLVAALAGPAAAHESSVEPKPKDEGLSCPELADEHAGGQTWQQFTIDDVADGDHSETYTVEGVGTVTVTVTGGKTFEWSSTFGIDAIYVQGRDAELSPNSYFYLYAPDASLDKEATEDIDLGTPPWHKWDTNKIKSISFCFDEEKETTPTTDTTMPTESTTSSVVESTTTSVESTTTSVEQTTTMQPATTTPAAEGGSTTTPQLTSNGGNLPKTGSDNTWMLLALGGLMVVGGGALIATTRIVRRRDA